MLRPSHLAALAALLLTTGCSSQDASPRESAGSPAAKPRGPLKVAPTDGRVGDATAATSAGGVKSLKVRRRPTRAGVVREGVGAGASCADVDLMPTLENLPAVAAATLCLVNGERADAGLPALSANAKLDQSAVAHSQDMVARAYFAHLALDGRDIVDRVRATGYIPDRGEWTVGENLAWGTGTLATPRAIVQAWMNSQGHRENVLRSGFREAGLGIVLGNPRSTDGQGATYTMNFGSTPGTTVQTLTSGAPAPQTSQSTRRAARRAARRTARRAALRRRKAARACRARALRTRDASVRRVRLRRCARAARRR